MLVFTSLHIEYELNTVHSVAEFLESESDIRVTQFRYSDCKAIEGITTVGVDLGISL